jgi:hypothetical protein
MGPFDLHSEDRAVLELDVEEAAGVDGLVVLGGLEVLGHVRVEVVLPGEAGPWRDLAVEGEPDPDGRLDGLLVDDRQGTRQAEADRADLGVGLGPEAGRAAAEHLRRGVELDVYLETHHGVVALDGLVVVDQVLGGGQRVAHLVTLPSA